LGKWRKIAKKHEKMGDISRKLGKGEKMAQKHENSRNPSKNPKKIVMFFKILKNRNSPK
jgi:hypothetical protein